MNDSFNCGENVSCLLPVESMFSWSIEGKGVFSFFTSAPRCAFKNLLFFNWSPGCSSHPPTLLLTRKPITVDLTCPLSLLVYRCVSGASLGTDQWSEAGKAIGWERGGGRSHVKGNQSQNHETGGCRDTWRAEGAQVVHCLEEEAETEERFCSSRAAFVASAERTWSFFLKGLERVRTEHAQWKTNQKLLNSTGKLAPSPPSTCIANKSCSNVHISTTFSLNSYLLLSCW